MFNIHVQGTKESRAHKNMDNILAALADLYAFQLLQQIKDM